MRLRIFLQTTVSALMIWFAVPNAWAQNTTSQPPIWQLNIKNGISANCDLQFTHVEKGANGQTCLAADSRNAKTEWNSCIMLPNVSLKQGNDYVVTINYEIISLNGTDSYFYVFARSAKLGIGADQWQPWRGKPGAKGVAKLRISATAADFVITMGIHNQGAIRINSMKVDPGSGWAQMPLTSAAPAAEASPPAITGAQPFTVDAPNNPDGPVLNLADFGAVADGNAPPLPGPDRNLIAMKAALAKCKSVKASKLIVPKGIYRFTSGSTIVFDGLTDFIFDGNGSTFLFHQVKGGAGMSLKNCNRTVFRNFNMDWDWKIDPLASIGRVTKLGPKTAWFEMRFDDKAPLNPKRWITMNPLDEKLRVPGAGEEFGNFGPRKIDSIDLKTVRVWPTWAVPAKAGQLYLLRHYTFEKHAIVMTSNTHLSMQYVTIFSFPGEGFIVGGDQHHFELLHCRITFPDKERRPITTTADGFHVDQSQGFIRLKDCDFGYMGDDCVNIHDNIHSGFTRLDGHTLVAENLLGWTCPYAAGDKVEIRNGDFSPTGFSGTLKSATSDYKKKNVTLVFDQELPAKIDPDAILFNHRYNSHNCIIQNCYFHENRARGVLCNTADWLIEGNRFYHNQHPAMLLITDVSSSWSEGFGARNVIVRNNQFETSNCMGTGDGAAIALSAAVNGVISSYPLIENILFESNTFKDMNGPAITAASFKNLVIVNNKLIDSVYPHVTPKMAASIRAELGNGLWINGNDWTTTAGTPIPYLFYDPQTATKIDCAGNRLQK